jgi:single-stranded DNA-binding protein
MISLNRIIIAGEVTNKPTLKTIDNRKQSILKIEVKDFWLDKDKNKVEKIIKINVFCYGNLAENVSKYLNKGKKAMIEGRIESEKNKVIINANNIVFLENN